MTIKNLLNKMEAAEQAFLSMEFLAPVLPHGRVQVCIAGMVCRLQVTGRVKPGWYLLKPLSLERARVLAPAGPKLVREYLALFPAVRLLLLSRFEGGRSPSAGRAWLALPAHRGDNRFQLDRPVPVQLVQNAERFQQVTARFDGGSFWFQAVDRRRNPAVAAYLREALVAEAQPEALRKATLTAEEQEAYRQAYQAVQAAQRDRVESRLSEALAHAGAELASYIERDEAYTVSFTVDGRQYRSTVRPDDLTVMAAGICLAGQDRRFDLQSLVGVIRQGRHGRRLVPVGAGEQLDEDAYWQFHPPVDEE